MRTYIVRAAIALALVPAVTGAQSLSLTEPEVLARLSPDSPRIRAIRAAADIARADVLAAGRWPNPTLTVDRESVAGITEYLTMVAQPLPITGRRGLAVQAATASASASASRADEDVRRFLRLRKLADPPRGKRRQLRFLLIEPIDGRHELGELPLLVGRLFLRQ